MNKLCDTCWTKRHGCACDGAFDAGCFLCTPDSFEEPPCICAKGSSPTLADDFKRLRELCAAAKLPEPPHTEDKDEDVIASAYAEGLRARLCNRPFTLETLALLEEANAAIQGQRIDKTAWNLRLRALMEGTR